MFSNRLFLVVAVLFVAATTASAIVVTTPGTPCADITGENAPCTGNTPPSAAILAADPAFNLIDPSVTNLGIFVVPGDVVLFETANGNLTDQSTWSDVVHFEDLANGGGSSATVYPDLDPGIQLPPNFALSANAVGQLEDPAVNFTTYIAGTATYNIFSDCSGPGCEVHEPNEGVPEPATAALLGSGLVVAFLVRRRFRT
jgi:hypothetical protein